MKHVSTLYWNLRIDTTKNHRQVKLQRLEKVRIPAFGLLVH